MICVRASNKHPAIISDHQLYVHISAQRSTDRFKKLDIPNKEINTKRQQSNPHPHRPSHHIANRGATLLFGIRNILGQGNWRNEMAGKHVPFHLCAQSQAKVLILLQFDAWQR